MEDGVSALQNKYRQVLPNIRELRSKFDLTNQTKDEQFQIKIIKQTVCMVANKPIQLP